LSNILYSIGRLAFLISKLLFIIRINEQGPREERTRQARKRLILVQWGHPTISKALDDEGDIRKAHYAGAPIELKIRDPQTVAAAQP